MKNILLLGAAVLLGTLLAAQAHAAPCDPTKSNTCVAKECPTLGLTQMQQDGKRILACLNGDSGTVWGSMTVTDEAAEPPPGTVCGMVLYQCKIFVVPGPDPTSTSSTNMCAFFPVASCKGVPLVVNTSPYSFMTTYALSNKCPEGYTFTGPTTGNNLSGFLGANVLNAFDTSIYACVKD